MKHDNPIPFTTRLKELFIGWLVIGAYLLCLFGVSMACYFLVLGGILIFFGAAQPADCPLFIGVGDHYAVRLS